MTKRLTPYIAFGIMLIILFFILGVRYGQQVEKTNKTINYLISRFPPSPLSPSSPPSPPLNFLSYDHKGCGIKFIYPSSLKKQKESSLSAEFVENKEKVLTVDCDPASLFAPIVKDDKIASEEIKLNNKPIRVKLNHEKAGDSYVFQIKNSYGKSIYVSILKSLYPLFEKSFEFIQK